MLPFATNIKLLRESRGLKQSGMLNALGFKRTTWNGYESDKSTPNIDDLIKIAKFFDLSESDLLHTDLSNTHLNQKKQTPKNKPNAHLNAHGNAHLNTHIGTVSEAQSSYEKTPFYTSRMPAIITVNESGIDNIIYVPIKAQAGYLLGFGDQEYIESLPSFRMPGLSNNTYRMFEVNGISMSPTLSDKDRVIAEWVPNIAEIRENRVHVVVHKEGIAVKRVLNRVKERNLIYLKSDTLTHRPDYPIKEIDPADIIEIWYVRLKVSGDLSEPSEVYTRLADLELNQHEILKKLGMK